MTSPLRGHPGAVRNDGAAGNYYAFGCVVCGAVPDGVVVSFFFFFTCFFGVACPPDVAAAPMRRRVILGALMMLKLAAP
jgi:hypothetical protein